MIRRTHGTRHRQDLEHRYRRLRETDDVTLNRRREVEEEADLPKQRRESSWELDCKFYGVQANPPLADLIEAVLVGRSTVPAAEPQRNLGPWGMLAAAFPFGQPPGTPKAVATVLSDAFLDELQTHMKLLAEGKPRPQEIIGASQDEIDWLCALLRLREPVRGVYQGFKGAMNSILQFERFWLRSPLDWKPERNFDEADFASLIRHLFEIYPIPQTLLTRAAWNSYEYFKPHECCKWRMWALIFGRGASMKRAATRFEWLWKAKLLQPLIQAGDRFDQPETACQWADAISQGASVELADAWVTHPGFRHDPTKLPLVRRFRSDWWMEAEADTYQLLRGEFDKETLRWLIRLQRSLDLTRLPMILDWAVHQFTEDRDRAGGQWKGRTSASVLRAAEEYQAQLRRAEELARDAAERGQMRHHVVSWPSHGWDWEMTDETGVVWTLRELLTASDLAEEGRAMHHCVVLYAKACGTGTCAIFSLWADGKRVATVELGLPARVIRQARGTCNRSVNQQESKVLEAWREQVLTF